MRVADGAANPHLASAAALFAALDGIERELDPPAPLSGLVYEDPNAANCPPLPRSFEAALEALESDEYLRRVMGEELVSTYLRIKQYELNRARLWTTDWEFAEYTHHL